MVPSGSAAVGKFLFFLRRVSGGPTNAEFTTQLQGFDDFWDAIRFPGRSFFSCKHDLLVFCRFLKDYEGPRGVLFFSAFCSSTPWKRKLSACYMLIGMLYVDWNA